MMSITGEQYIRTLAQFIRSNERKLTVTSPPPPLSGHLSGHKRSDSGGGSFTMSNLWSFSAALTSSYFNPTTSTASTTPTSPPSSVNNPSKIFVALDPHHLYYLLARFSDLGFDIGAFEYVVDYKQGDGTLDTDVKDLETSSVTSSNSISSMSSAMSSLSLFSGWQGWYSAAQKNASIPINQEIQYIYRAFIKLTNLNIAILNQKMIAGHEIWPKNTLLSLTMFKNLTSVEIYGLPPKMFDGWDILQEKLEYLSLQQGSIEDIYELFVDVVVDSMKRRKSKDDNKAITNKNQVTQESQDVVEQTKTGDLKDYSPDSILPQKIWSNLKQVNLSNNTLTFVASEPLAYINKVTHMDLSQNLLIAVPSGLSQLFNLQHLNISNNMIESVTGIYNMLSNITKLELQNNRIDNLCGLERLLSLEYVDIRENKLTDWAEVGRMAELRDIRQIYVEGNPFTRLQPNYRVNLFTVYRENNKDIILDGTAPGYNERRQINVSPKSSPSSQKIPLAVVSGDSILSSPVLSSDDQSPPVPVLRTKKSRKFRKRVVNLDGDDRNSDSDGSDVASIKSSKSSRGKKKKKEKSDKKLIIPEPIPIRPASPSGDEYRRKIEELRTEGGSAWLRVLSEMEYAKGDTDRLREPPKMKAVMEQLMATRDRA